MKAGETGNVSNNSSRSVSPDIAELSTVRAGHRDVTLKPDVKEKLLTAQTETDSSSEEQTSPLSSSSLSSISRRQERSEEQTKRLKQRKLNKTERAIISKCQHAIPKATIDTIPGLLKSLFHEHRVFREVLFPHIASDENLKEKLSKEEVNTIEKMRLIDFKEIREKREQRHEEITKQSECFHQSLISLRERYESFPREQPTSSTDQQELIGSTCSVLKTLEEQFSTLKDFLSKEPERNQELMGTETKRVKLERELQFLQTLSDHLTSTSSASERKRPAETSISEEPTTSKKAKLKDSESSS